MDRAHLIFHGKVQGVFFRSNCRRKALELGLTGWVRNLPNGTVESIVEGDARRIKVFIEWCRNRQPLARVKRVEENWTEGDPEFTHFSIIR